MLYSGDLPASLLAAAREARAVAWDTETTGLDWRTAQLGTCQLFIPGSGPFIVQGMNGAPENLVRLLGDASVQKVFHHATFDLSFLMTHWGAEARNIACTKVASKLAFPEESDHSLKTILARHLRIEVAKSASVRVSNWNSPTLSIEQIQYAESDVLYLLPLLETLREELVASRRLALAQAAFDFLPFNVRIRALGLANVFEY